MLPFRIVLKHARVVRGDLHHDVAMLAKRGEKWEVCGLLMLHASEWEQLRLICEVVGIEIKNEVPPAVTEATAI